MRRLNLGCGELAVDGAIGVDWRPTAACDVLWDLNEVPWPFPDGRFEEVFAIDVYEHVADPIVFMDEVWRVAAPGALLRVRTSNWRSENSFRDPTHRRFLTLGSFDFFDPETEVGRKYHWYTGRKWRVVERGVSGQELVFSLRKGAE